MIKRMKADSVHPHRHLLHIPGTSGPGLCQMYGTIFIFCFSKVSS